MHDRLSRLGETPAQWRDGALGAIVAIVCVTELAFAAPIGTALTLAVGSVGLFGAVAVVMRRRRPMALALTFSAACLIPGIFIGSRWVNAPSDSAQLTIIILAYTVGASVDGVAAVIGLIALCAGSSRGDFSDQILLFVFTVPAWLAGTAIRSRTRLTAQLADRAQELEREAYAQEAVRYVRIARDLHDIVAHNLRMIVIQPGAGRRALSSNPATAVESLRHIEGGAAPAELEIAQLVDLLEGQQAATDPTGLRALDELVRRAAATGLAVSYVFSGDDIEVSPALADAAFRVTQEGITNALKHAPGAPVSVAVHAAPDGLSVVVENGPPRDPPTTRLQETGGTHGLTGLRDHVAAVGGDLRAGPTLEGGWRVAAEMPTS